MLVGTFENADDVGHVGRKCTQILFDALLVPDIRKNFMKDRKLRAFRRRNVQAGLSHQREKTDGLQ